MEFLKAQLTRVQEQLAGLSASQKMLTASLVAIMVMTTLWWSHWAAEPEMEALLPNQSLNADDIAQIGASLDAKGIPHKIVLDKVMVPADRKVEILAGLGFSQSLPGDFHNAFDDLVLKQVTWLDSPDKTDRMYLEVKQRTLEQLIGQFPGVSRAKVVIDPTVVRAFDNSGIQKSASISITTKSNSKVSPRQLAESAAGMVSGAEAGLARAKINIVIDGMPFQVKDREDDGLMNGSVVEDEIKAEQQYQEKILANFGDIHGVLVSVKVKLNTAASVINSRSVDPKEVVSLPVTTDEKSQEMTPATGGAQDAGAVANLGLNLSNPGGSGSGSGSSTNTESKTSLQNDYSTTNKTVKQPAGDVTVESASVRVPRSHFVGEFKQLYQKDPDEAALAAYMKPELESIGKAVKACTGITSDSAIVVDVYTDALPVESMSPQTASSPIAVTLSGYSKEIAIGLLAVVSLFMVSMMVRKGVPAPALVMASEPSEPTQISAMEAVAGEVGEGNPMLDAVELDDSAVKSQQMLDQVQQMVQANPDAAANLVKRWLNRT